MRLTFVEGIGVIDNFREGLAKWAEAGKNVFGLLRDAALFALLLLLVACPALINDRLERTGLSSVEGPGFKWEREVEKAKQQGLTAVSQVDRLQQQAKQTLVQVDRIAAANPELAREVAPIRASLKQTTRQLDTTSNQLASAVIRQQRILSEAAPETTPITGWVIVAFTRVDGRIEPGSTAEVRTSRLNVRSGAGSNYPTVAILPEGTRVRIDEVQRVEAQLAAPVVWARVTQI